MKPDSFRNQVPKNIAVNVLTFMSTVVIGLWLTPYLLKSLGIVAYGLIPLAMFFSQYVGVILNSINMSINRFLLISIQKKLDVEANEIFNTSLIIIVVFTILQAIIMGVILFDITFFFEIPDDLVTDAIWLFGLTFAGFSISLLRSVFGTSIFSYNRLDILRYIDILQNIVRVSSIIILFSYDQPSLKYIGIANLLSAMAAIVPTLYYFKKFTPQLKVNIILFKKKRVKELSKLSIWILINQVGVLLFSNVDLYFVNRFIGSSATGEYAIIIQVTTLFRTMAGLLAGVLTPVIMIYYSNKEHDKVKKILVLAAKLMAIVMVIPLTIAIYFSGDLVSIWLGKEFSYLKNLLSYSLLFLLFAIPTMPLYSANVAYNKVKLPAILTILLGVVNVISMYLLLIYTELGLWSVIIARLLYEFLYNSIFMSIYVSKITQTNSKMFLQVPLISVISFVCIYAFIYAVNSFINIVSFNEIFIFSIILFMVSAPILYTVFFTKNEKHFLRVRYFDKLLLKIRKVGLFKI